VKEGFVHPGRGVRGELRFTFQHLVLLRTAKELLAVRSPAKVKRALNSLRRQLPTGRDLASLRITAQGDEIIATDDGESWIPSSGQTLINFKTADIAASVAPLAKEAEDESPLELVEEALTAEDWYELGCELEPVDHEQAREAYRRVLEYHPDHPDAHVNLGRILHEAGEISAAERHYRMALAARPEDSIASFNLGVALQDMGELDEAIEAYAMALRVDPSLADAHYNISTLYEVLGRKHLAIKHLQQYRLIVRE
jgi:tetratricopeptide (TPR) repeat protein